MRRSIAITAVLAAAALLPSPAAAIVGGQPTTTKWPWMVEFQVDGSLYCGASLVRQEWVLTAAHCVEGLDESRITLVLGRPTRSETSKGVALKAAQVIAHEGFARGSRVMDTSNDVALIKLSAPAPAEYTPIRIAGAGDESQWSAGVSAKAIGWGLDNYFVGSDTDELHEVDLEIRSDEECALVSYGQFDPASMLCAGETLGGKDTCSGDSGGPLMVPGRDTPWLLAGVTSFGTACGVPTQYGIYSRVGGAALREWLNSHLPAVTAPAGTATPPATTTGKARAPKVGRDAGSARRANSARTIVLRLRAADRVENVTVEAKQGGRLVARAKAASLEGSERLRAKLLRRVRPGRLELKLVFAARDGAGRQVTKAVVRLKR